MYRVVGGGVYSGIGVGVYAGACDWFRGVQGEPHKASPSAPIDSRHFASLHEYSRETVVVGAGTDSLVGMYVVAVSTPAVAVTLGTGADVAGGAEVVAVAGAALLVLVVTAELGSFGSSSPTAAPSARSPTNPAPTTHGHFRRFFASPEAGSPPEPTGPKTWVGASPPLGLVRSVHCRPSQ